MIVQRLVEFLDIPQSIISGKRRANRLRYRNGTDLPFSL